MSKILVAVLLFIVSFPAMGCNIRDEFTDQQWHVIRSAFIGSWYTGYKYTMAAIAIKESSAGVNVINDVTKDYGIYQINVKTAMSRLQNWAANGREFDVDVSDEAQVRELLINDELIGRQLAIEELRFWDRSRSGNWKETWASYNGGYYKGTPREDRAIGYSEDIKNNVRELQMCVKELV